MQDAKSDAAGNVMPGVYRAPSGMSFGFLKDQWWRLCDQEGPNLAPSDRPSGVNFIPAKQHTFEEARAFEALSRLFNTADALQIFSTDDEAFYKTGKGRTFLIAQGRVGVCRPRPLPFGARVSVTFDPMLKHWAQLAEDSEGEIPIDTSDLGDC